VQDDESMEGGIGWRIYHSERGRPKLMRPWSSKWRVRSVIATRSVLSFSKIRRPRSEVRWYGGGADLPGAVYSGLGTISNSPVSAVSSGPPLSHQLTPLKLERIRVLTPLYVIELLST
jgi:hypothetical protein